MRWPEVSSPMQEVLYLVLLVTENCIRLAVANVLSSASSASPTSDLHHITKTRKFTQINSEGVIALYSFHYIVISALLL